MPAEFATEAAQEARLRCAKPLRGRLRSQHRGLERSGHRVDRLFGQALLVRSGQKARSLTNRLDRNLGLATVAYMTVRKFSVIAEHARRAAWALPVPTAEFGSNYRFAASTRCIPTRGARFPPLSIGVPEGRPRQTALQASPDTSHFESSVPVSPSAWIRPAQGDTSKHPDAHSGRPERHRGTSGSSVRRREA
jgi:hypothetical protein